MSTWSRYWTLPHFSDSDLTAVKGQQAAVSQQFPSEPRAGIKGLVDWKKERKGKSTGDLHQAALSNTALNLQLVSWCFEPSQPQRITSGLNTNFALSPSYSFHKSSYHKSCFFGLLIFHGQSTPEPASSRVTYFILQAYTGTGVSHSQRRKKSGEGLETNVGEWTGRVEISKEENPGSKHVWL